MGEGLPGEHVADLGGWVAQAGTALCPLDGPGPAQTSKASNNGWVPGSAFGAGHTRRISGRTA